MAKTKTVYVAEDGKEFYDEHDCDAHDAFLKNQFSVEAFIADQDLHKAQAGLMRRILPAYLAFRERDDHSELVMAAAEKAEAEAEAEADAAATETQPA